jgi:hypothetical protein
MSNQIKYGDTNYIEALSGREVYGLLRQSNPDLAKRIKEYIFADDDIIAFKADYLFGEKIIQNKEIFLPLKNGKSISLTDTTLPKILVDHLGYTPGISNPVGIVLNKESEFYQIAKQRIVSYGTIKPGQVLGYASIIDRAMMVNLGNKKLKKYFVSNWDLNAGARLAFILPQISENQKHTKMLKIYGINVEKSADYIGQMHVFNALNASTDVPWTQSILYLSNHFLDKLINKPEYLEAHQALIDLHRSAYNIWHTTYAKWESDINKILDELELNKYSAYAVNVAKHIYLIVASGAPGFIPATNEDMLPKQLLEEAYTGNGYGLTENWPITMQPSVFTIETATPVYYGLKLPTLINYNPEAFGGKTTIALLYEIATILNRCQAYILSKFEDKDSQLYETAVNVKFSFYHSDTELDKYNGVIKNSTLLPQEDERFYKRGWIFPHLAGFVRGCVKIEHIK